MKIEKLHNYLDSLSDHVKDIFVFDHRKNSFRDATDLDDFSFEITDQGDAALLIDNDDYTKENEPDYGSDIAEHMFRETISEESTHRLTLNTFLNWAFSQGLTCISDLDKPVFKNYTLGGRLYSTEEVIEKFLKKEDL